MGRNTRRAGEKARQAIKETSQSFRAKKHTVQSENPHPAQGGVKRASSPSSIVPPVAKRNALGDVTNNALKRQGLPKTKPPNVTATLKPVSAPAPSLSQQSKKKNDKMADLNMSVEDSQTSSSSSIGEDTPVTAMQNVLQATTLSDDSLRSDESLEDEAPPTTSSSTASSPHPMAWKDIDAADSHDPLFSSEYAPGIYRYMKEREVLFTLESYMHKQPDISASMRTILVDWLIEVQENFELFHETLYLAVKLVDLYLSRKEVKREYLQLVGATSMLIAAKFEELSPPLVDDFLYLCDDAYTHSDMLNMERDVLRVIEYDINIPVAYRFLRRLARAADANLETHTLARYITESTLQDFQFVDVRPSLVAAAAMYLSLRMRRLGPWFYSGYSVEEMLPLLHRLNTLIQAPLGQTNTVRCKYSHEVFFKVALTEPLQNVEEDAKMALSECPTLPS